MTIKIYTFPVRGKATYYIYGEGERQIKLFLAVADP